MGNCLSTCTKSSESGAQGPTAEGFQQTDPTQPVPAGAQVSGGERVRALVQQELQALQSQISHSQAVLAQLHFRFNDESVSDSKSELAKVHRTTQTSNPDTLPKSLECVPVAVEKDWQQITSSCPAIVNTAVQTDDETTSKSNGTSGDYFLPPISPLDSQVSEPPSPKDLDTVSSKPFEPRPLGHIDLDIYRSCRKLSVLPEEEGMVEETSPPQGSRLAPSHYPHQTHSFESYLLPVSGPSVRRQLSDPTPSPEIHPVSRRSSRSTCRPLQLQPDNYFKFPDVKSSSVGPSQEPPQPPKSPSCVKFQSTLDFSEEDYLPRITSPTYNILQDTVSQLITMSTESLDAPVETAVRKKESLAIPSYYAFTPEGSTPFKTPPENSLMSTPGFFTPQEVCEKRLPESATSSSFQTPTSVSPGTNGIQIESNKSTSNSSQSFKTPPLDASGGTSYQSSYSSPLYMSPLLNKRLQQSNTNNEHVFMEVPDLKNIQTNGKLYVKPLPGEFDRNRTMLSILLDEPRVQNDNTNVSSAEDYTMPFISFTSLDIQHPPAPVHASPSQVPSSCLSPSDPVLSPNGEGLARTPSRRRLQRSLVRISSETPLELVPVQASGTSLPADDAAAPAPLPTTTTQDGPKMRRTNSDGGSGALGSVGALTASHSFPSLSDTVLRQLGALMEEVKQQKEESQSSETEIESKFTSLMLAFKTDKLTLDKRLELQLRLRDQAEQNMAVELNKLKAAVQLLSPLCTDSEKIELLEKVSEQVDALHKSTTRVSTSAEMYGAVQQENRLSKAVDIVLRHVENLKQAYDKERTDHEETRKVLSDNKISPSAVLKLEGRSVSRARLGSLPRRLSNTILEADLEENTTSKDPTGDSTGSSQPREPAQSVSSPAQSPTRTLQRKPSRPTIVEERRVSHTGETESDDDTLSPEPVRVTDPLPSTDLCPASSSQRRVSIQAAWLSKLSEQLDWARPMDQLFMHLRYFVAVLLLIAALAVFTSTFILPHTRLGS